MDRTETLIIEQLKAGGEMAYRYIFEHHYAVLCQVAVQVVGDDFLAETIVGDTIYHLWEKREHLQIDVSLRSFLMRSVRNRALDYVRSRYNKQETALSKLDGGTADMPESRHPLNALLLKELEEEVDQAISHLPDDCRNVFMKSRFEGKRYEDIAQETGISVNTVKYHIKRALQLMSDELQKYR